MNPGLVKVLRYCVAGLLLVYAIGFSIRFGLPYYANREHNDGPPGLPRTCLSNVRHMLAATLMYDQESGRLPPAQHWMDAVSPLMKGIDKFKCPGLPADNPYTFGYAMHSRLGGVGVHTLASPSREPLEFDSWPLGRNAHTNMVVIPGFTRHGGQNIGYADGHASAWRLK